MAQDPPHDRPVLSGIIALLATTLVIGLVLGGGAFLVTQVFAGGEADVEGEASSQQTLVIPDAGEDEEDEDGGLDLPGGPGRPSTTLGPVDPEDSPSQAPGGITLAPGSGSVGAGQQLDLTGTYPGGDGAVLQVQQFADGAWIDFGVDATVTGGSYSTYIITSQVGDNRYRMNDPAAGMASNEIRVTIT